MGPEILLSAFVAVIVAVITGGPAWMTARKAKQSSERAKQSSDQAKQSSDRARVTTDVGQAAILGAIDNLDRKMDEQAVRTARIETWAKLHDREHGHSSVGVWQ